MLETLVYLCVLCLKLAYCSQCRNWPLAEGCDFYSNQFRNLPGRLSFPAVSVSESVAEYLFYVFRYLLAFVDFEFKIEPADILRVLGYNTI
jgi:hypothetical protein